MAQEAPSPNLFELSCGETQVSYSTSSFAGPPLFSYAGPKGEHNFSGDEIQTLGSALGMEVTVTLDTIPDLHTITLTVLLPAITLSPGGEESFETAGIFTTSKTTIAGPPTGVTQSYEIIALDGVAKLVSF
jgi:hypothetical protein